MLDKPSKSNHPDPMVQRRMEEAISLQESGRLKEAVGLLEENILEGCSDSMVLLGTILADGTEEERKRSLVLFRSAGEEGNHSGLRNLGYCYAIGLNVEKDKTKGAELYIRSAELGNPRSACNIGVMFDYGNGVEQNFREAFYWYTRSAEGGYARGMTNLGEYYLWGRGTEKNIGQAIRWFEESGSPRAIFRLSEIYLGEEGYLDEDKGRELLKRCAEMGYTKGMVEYGFLIENEEPETARTMFERAASKGNAEAIEWLKKKGFPVPESNFSRGRKKTQTSE